MSYSSAFILGLSANSHSVITGVLQASGIAPVLSPQRLIQHSSSYSSNPYPQPQSGPSQRGQVLKRPRKSGDFDDDENKKVPTYVGDLSGASDDPADLADDAKLLELRVKSLQIDVFCEILISSTEPNSSHPFPEES